MDTRTLCSNLGPPIFLDIHYIKLARNFHRSDKPYAAGIKKKSYLILKGSFALSEQSFLRLNHNSLHIPMTLNSRSRKKHCRTNSSSGFISKNRAPGRNLDNSGLPWVTNPLNFFMTIATSGSLKITYPTYYPPRVFLLLITRKLWQQLHSILRIYSPIRNLSLSSQKF